MSNAATTNLCRSTRRLTGSPGVFHGAGGFGATVSSLHRTASTAVRARHTGTLGSIRSVHTEVRSSARCRRTARTTRAGIRARLSRITRHVRHVPFVCGVHRDMRRLDRHACPRLVGTLTTSTPEPGASLTKRIRTTATAAPVSTGVPRSRRKGAPHITISFTAVDEPRAGSTLRARSSISSFLSTCHHRLVTTVRGKGGVLL